MTQTKLDFGPTYQGHPPYWFARALRLMSHYAVAQDVGLLGYAVLVEIVLSEDKRRYCSAPKWFKRSLAERLDRQVEAVSDAIQRCVDHGWLVWHQPHHRSKASTWVTIPVHVDQSVLADDRPENPVYHPVKDQSNDPVKDPANHPVKDPRSNTPSLDPVPTPSPPGDGWLAAVEEITKSGIIQIDSTVRSCREHGLTPSNVLALVTWWREHSDGFLRPPGALRFALTTTRPLSPSKPLPDDLAGCFPPLDPQWAQRVADRQRSAREAAAALQSRQKTETYLTNRVSESQLVIDWERAYGPILDAMPEDRVWELCPPAILDICKKRGRKFGMVRHELLRVLATQAS